ncbi:MAG: enoyl-CoA hydratase/isomerase family protein, partial [Rhodospirillaceae bacterium]|nr:enoyl-CoA hydratase/isomerase family protein [Rhodospirillaceae bacterium]
MTGRGADPEVLFARRGRLGRITLNRPGALNALTLGMAEAMDAQLRAWADDGDVAAVFVTG